MERKRYYKWRTVGEAVQGIIHVLLEDNLEDIPYVHTFLQLSPVEFAIDPRKDIYFDGWSGLAASAVLRAIAEDPPTPLKRKFDSIIHIDCSRWKSRRSLQRTIVEKLELPQRVMAILDRQDKEDDYGMVDEASRNEIQDVATETHQAQQGRRCLVIFHNGSNDVVDLSDFGIYEPKWSRASKVLWTFRGRLRLNPDIEQKVGLPPDNQFRCLTSISDHEWEVLLREEAREIVRYTHELSTTPEIAAECCLYLLSLNSMGGDTMGYNWVTHAFNYWVCDGIINGGQGDEAWEVGRALYQELRLEEYLSNRLPYFGDRLGTPLNRWVSKNIKATQTEVPTIPLESSSFFVAFESLSDQPIPSLPNNMFQQSAKLRVLKLCCCTFCFSLPPFHHCRGLRFLAIDKCKDRRQEEVEQQRQVLEFLESLWVLDICQTDWELDLSSKITEKMATNIREIHIKRGRIWCNHLAWRRLHNLRKIQVIEPSCSWESGNKDEFSHMLKLELLNLSGNCTIQVLPSLSEATSLKTLILDGCTGLEHVGPDGLPPSLESFSLDAGSSQKDEAKVSKISLISCVNLRSFTLRGALPRLEELDLSCTSIRKLNLSNAVVQVPKLERVFLVGCKQLLAIQWWNERRKLKVLRINNQENDALRTQDSSSVRTESRIYDGEVFVKDARFIQSLWTRPGTDAGDLITDSLYLNLDSSSASKNEGRSNNNVGIESYSGKVVWPVRNSLIPTKHCYNDVLLYSSVLLDGAADVHEVRRLLPLGCHVEISDGINLTDMNSDNAIRAITHLIAQCTSLDIHDNFSIAIAPKIRRFSASYRSLSLKWCRVERCPKLKVVFVSDMYFYVFSELETIWVVDLLTAGCIWSKGIIKPGISFVDLIDRKSRFGKLQSIHLYGCPRLKYVLPITSFIFPSLENLHIVHCGDLKHVFPWDVNYKVRKGYMVNNPKLKNIHLHELASLQQICETKMFAPELKTIKLRGCWNLRRLPAIDRHRRDSRPVVDCEKDMWEKLEWDGLEAGHDPSLFEPRHSSYYKKPMPRVSFLR